MTSDTVAGDKLRRSANCLRLTGLGPMRTARAAPLARFFVVTLRSLAQTNWGSKRMFATPRAKLIDIGMKNVFHKVR